MKGMAMKLGQVISYMDVPLPDVVQGKLARLQTGEQAMDLETVQAVVERAFDAPPASLFERFDAQPIAAASIGQVHRARFAGREVAVKVQYPDVAQSFEDDLGTITRFASLASLASAVDGRAIVEELRARLREECDYLREARYQQAFAARFAGQPEIVVPEVIADRCAPTVLTTRWCDGARFEAFCSDATQPQRDAAAHTLVRFSYLSLLSLHTIQADPHPGNYLFEARAIAFLDFGCVRVLPADFAAALRATIVALRRDDRAAFDEAITALGLVGNARRFDFAHAYAMMKHLYRPLLAPRFAFTREYLREGYQYNGPRSPNARTLSIPPAYVWVARLQWGLWALLARLGAEGRFAPVLDEALAAPTCALAAA
ncbi:MAG: AarF/ABC1/UbiB kinase family protein [Myxococcales bacterium]|nr:AarF/ABC1/UbiB kinase family protein [Myxococcales bacterium]